MFAATKLLLLDLWFNNCAFQHQFLTFSNTFTTFLEVNQLNSACAGALLSL